MDVPSEVEGLTAMDFLDAHVHLWDTAVFDLPWLANVPELAQRYSLADLGSDLPQHVICVQAGASLIEAQWLVAQAQQSPRIAAVVLQFEPSDVPGAWAGAVHPAVLSSMNDGGPVAGVRVPARGAPDDIDELAGIDQLCAGLGRNGLVLEWLIRPSQFAAVAKLARRFPNVPMVLCHMGIGADPIPHDWVDRLAELAACPNVFAKISGILSPVGHTEHEADPARVVRSALEYFGTDRIMFGSDWPMITRTGRDYDAVVEVIEGLVVGCSAEQREQFFGGTARTVYGVRSSSKSPAVTIDEYVQEKG